MLQHEISKQNKTKMFNPNGVGNTSGNIFGLPYTVEESDVVIIPVPWDVTVSRGEGADQGPKNVFYESFQIDLFDEVVADPWKAGIAMESIPEDIINLNHKLRKKARKYIKHYEKTGGDLLPAKYIKLRQEINDGCYKLFESITSKCRNYLADNKLPVILGGDHSTSLGLLKALSEIHNEFGVLQIDAHADLRPAFKGLTHSHASIMFNALEYSQISKLVQVGIRDFCSQEWNLINDNGSRLRAFTSRELQNQLSDGITWKNICDEIIRALPEKVYISFDVDGLEPSYCQSTGTPVPGGLSYNQAIYLIEKLVERGKTIIGFDIVETGPHPLDGVVSCRLLYRIIALMLRANKRL